MLGFMLQPNLLAVVKPLRPFLFHCGNFKGDLRATVDFNQLRRFFDKKSGKSKISQPLSMNATVAHLPASRGVLFRRTLGQFHIQRKRTSTVPRIRSYSAVEACAGLQGRAKLIPVSVRRLKRLRGSILKPQFSLRLLAKWKVLSCQ